MKKIIFIGLLFLSEIVLAQNNTGNYIDSLQRFRQEYISTHDVVKGDDTLFLKFYPIDETFRVIAFFEEIKDSIGFGMNTSSGKVRRFFKFGKITFNLKNKTCQLFVYRAEWMMKTEKFKDILFIPFTDLTNGIETHGTGRYFDLTTNDIKNNSIVLDFNKAYNPSCAYKEGFSCPLPPKENDLKVAINAGEKIFGKLNSK